MVCLNDSISGSLVAIALSDRLGRKLLLIISGLGMGTSNLLLLLAQMGLFVTESGIESTAVTLIAYSSFFVFFSVGFGGIPFVILGEVFPPKTKGLASSISVTFLWQCDQIFFLKNRQQFLKNRQFSRHCSKIGQNVNFW